MNKLEKAVENLKEYIAQDTIYQNKGIESPSDFDKFCISHCEDIEVVLKALENSISKIEKFYDGEVFTAKQLKFIEQQQKKYFINKEIIKKKIGELKNMNVDGEVFTTSVNFATKVLQELCER